MDGLRKQGIESLAIPHNSNGSNGQMFKLVDWAGDPIDDAYAEQRIRNEPLVEITQVKGTSETHPLLSTRDEWADFEIMPYRVATMLPSEPAGSYVRDALRRGLALESRGIANPYAMLLSTAMMLRHSLDDEEAADALESCVYGCWEDGILTKDLDPDGLGTQEITDAVCERLVR